MNELSGKFIALDATQEKFGSSNDNLLPHDYLLSHADSHNSGSNSNNDTTHNKVANNQLPDSNNLPPDQHNLPGLEFIKPIYDNNAGQLTCITKSQLDQFGRDTAELGNWSKQFLELTQGQPQNKVLLEKHLHLLDNSPMRELIERGKKTFKDNYIPSYMAHLDATWNQADDNYAIFVEAIAAMKDMLDSGQEDSIKYSARQIKVLTDNLGKCSERLTLEDPQELERQEKIQANLKDFLVKTKEQREACHPYRDLYNRFDETYNFATNLEDNIKKVYSGELSQQTIEAQFRGFVVIAGRLKAQINQKELYDGIESRTDIQKEDKADFIELRDRVYNCLSYIDQAIDMITERNRTQNYSSSYKEFSKIFRTISKKSQDSRGYTPEFYLSEQDIDPRIVERIKDIHKAN